MFWEAVGTGVCQPQGNVYVAKGFSTSEVDEVNASQGGFDINTCSRWLSCFFQAECGNQRKEDKFGLAWSIVKFLVFRPVRAIY